MNLELESFVAFHPGGDPADLVTVIEERTISALSLLENFYQSVIDPAVRDLRFLKVQTPDEKHPKPTPQNRDRHAFERADCRRLGIRGSPTIWVF